MSRLLPFLVALAVGAVGVAPSTASASALACTLYYNGRIWQGPGQPDVEAMLTCGSRIVATGRRSYLEGVAASGMEPVRAAYVNLGGRRVIPGLVDGHSHPETFAAPEWMANAPDWVERGEYGPTADEVRALAAAKAATSPAGQPVVVIVGINFYRSAPDDVRAFLDSVTTAHPVLAIDWGGHGHAVNSRLLAEAGYADGTPDTETGRVSRDASGRLTGWVQEMMELKVFWALTNRLPDEYLAAALARYGNGWSAWGGASVYDINAFVRPSRIQHIRDLAAQQTRVPFYGVTILTDSGPRPGVNAQGRKLWKVFLDGAPGDCTALRFPSPPLAYVAPDTCPIVYSLPWYGAPDVSTGFIESVLRDARAQGAHVLFHGLGEGAVERLLQALAVVGGTWQGTVTLEHGDLVTREQLGRLAAFGVPLLQNPTHLVSVPGLTLARFNPASVASTELLASVRGAGVLLGFGTDAFGFPTNPWLEMQLATVHPFNPSEAISRADFLAGYTRNVAQARGQGLANKATLEPGQPATFAVLSQDVLDTAAVPVEALPSTTSLLTVIGGQVAHSTGAIR